MLRSLNVVLLLVALVSFSQSLQADEAAPLIDRVVAAYGGKGALEKSRFVVQEGRFVSLMRGGQESAIRRSLRSPDRLRIEIGHPGEPAEVRVLDGERGWKNGQVAAPPLRIAMLLQAARIALPALLHDRRSEVRDLGHAATPSGETRHVLEVPLGPDVSLFVEIDPATALIRRSAGIMSMAGHSMEFAAEYSDFRDWDGVLVAAREDQFAMGQPIGHTLLDSIDFPATLPDAVFRP